MLATPTFLADQWEAWWHDGLRDSQSPVTSFPLLLQDRKAPDGHPEFMSHLLLCLGGDYPIRPRLTAGLVPYQVNVWMGASKSGAIPSLRTAHQALSEQHKDGTTLSLKLVFQSR